MFVAREQAKGLAPFVLLLAAKGHELDLQWTADSSYARLKRRNKSKGTNGRGWWQAANASGVAWVRCNGNFIFFLSTCWLLAVWCAKFSRSCAHGGATVLEASRCVLLRLLQLLSSRVIEATAVTGQSWVVLGRAGDQSLCRKFFTLSHHSASLSGWLQMTPDDSR